MCVTGVSPIAVYSAGEQAMANRYCEKLGIDVPALDRIAGKRLVAGGQQTVFGLLVVALLERGGPMTLEDVAHRMEEAGVAPADAALRSLKRCRPARAPVYRDENEYGLDTDSDELDLLLFSYGLRPPRLPDPPASPTKARLDWDANAFLARSREIEREREEHAAELAALRRAIVHIFPTERPVAATILDVDAHELWTSTGDELDATRERLAGYEVLAGIDIRAMLRALAFDPGDRRLADLSPPQRTVSLEHGRSLRLTTAMLVQGSCGISRPFAAGDRMRSYLAGGQTTKLRRRLEADAMSLYALYQYGRTHGCLRLRWANIDDMLPVPWVHGDEDVLDHLSSKAFTLGIAIEAVVGRAPEWTVPWARARLLRVIVGRREHDRILIDEDGFEVDERDVQVARLAVAIH